MNTKKAIASNNWQKILLNSVTNLQDLLGILNLKTTDFKSKPIDIKHFPIRVPKNYIKNMNYQDPKDPLLLQILPTKDELIKKSSFSNDPLFETNYNPLPGVLHKYHGRALILFNRNCAINCRFCFRKYFPYHTNQINHKDYNNIIKYINNDSSLYEIILSGGDPLLSDDKTLINVINIISNIPHVKTIRIHSRMPIVIPERITNNFINKLSKIKIPIILIVHSNHPNEINNIVIEKMKLLKKKGVHLLNQTVLLKQINDNAKTLINLSYRLLEANILPHYLHMPDSVAGNHKFNVNKTKAIQIYKELLTQLPGYLVPKLTKEIPGVPFKVPLSVS
jgi:EF-P beta-lysylation protein EpmB